MIDLHESLLEVPKDQIIKFCSICREIMKNQCIIKDCKHCFCQNCMKLYLEYKITSGEVLSISCPYSDCITELEDAFIRANISQQVYSKYKSFKKLRLLEKNINLRWCSRNGCQGYSIGSLKNRRLICNVCEFNYCFFCGDQ